MRGAARKEFGEEQVHIWRRSYDIPPPDGESLKMTAARTLYVLSLSPSSPTNFIESPYYESEIVPRYAALTRK